MLSFNVSLNGKKLCLAGVGERGVLSTIDYLGGAPVVQAKPVKTSEDTPEMLWFDLQNENETVRNYRDRVRQCEALGEFAMAEKIRNILVQEQEHQIDLASALGEEVHNVTPQEAVK